MLDSCIQHTCCAHWLAPSLRVSTLRALWAWFGHGWVHIGPCYCSLPIPTHATCLEGACTPKHVVHTLPSSHTHSITFTSSLCSSTTVVGVALVQATCGMLGILPTWCPKVVNKRGMIHILSAPIVLGKAPYCHYYSGVCENGVLKSTWLFLCYFCCYLAVISALGPQGGTGWGDPWERSCPPCKGGPRSRLAHGIGLLVGLVWKWAIRGSATCLKGTNLEWGHQCTPTCP